ncbi:MAG: Omp28-related outer membrane protein [Bacteroides sp.]|nr:Omp28-related outer membrane protein [Bacteroides sp.]MCM1085991.1 Omp28-related outer membrane protein [Bacteroides sp.]
MEEFTAIHCSYCPQGHAIAQSMHNVLGERLQTIAVHTSGLATPGGNEPDFRTDAGALWFERSGQSGMPSGALNRHSFENLKVGDYGLGRGDWQVAARRCLNDTAKVNLYAEASLDTLTRLLTVRVEYFYPKIVEEPFNALTLAITENYIPGTQSGSTGGAQYLHRHVLRNLITPVWGDTLYEMTAGQVFEKTYRYTLPAQYVNRAPKFADLEVIAFMSDTAGEILNSTSARVEYSERYAAPQLLVGTPSLARRHSRTSIPVRVENLGTDTVRSLSFSIEWNGETYSPTVNAFSIPYGEEREIEVPLGAYEFAKVLRYRITVTHADGREVSCNTVSDYLSEPYAVSTEKVMFELATDEYGEDITYTLRKRDGTVVASGGPFENGEERKYAAEWTLVPDSVYSLEIKDAFADGFNGGYRLKDAAGNVIASEIAVGMYGSTVSFVYRMSAANEGVERNNAMPRIGLSPNPIPVTRPDNKITLSGFGDAQAHLSVFDLQGREVFSAEVKVQNAQPVIYNLDTKPFKSGFYFVRVDAGNNVAVQKMLIL